MLTKRRRGRCHEGCSRHRLDQSGRYKRPVRRKHVLFGNGKPGQLRWKPYYTQIIRLYWLGTKPMDIAKELGCSAATVGTVIHSDQGTVLLAELEAKTYDSSLEVITLVASASSKC